MVKEEQNSETIVREDRKYLERNVADHFFPPLSQEKRSNEIQATGDLFMMTK